LTHGLLRELGHRSEIYCAHKSGDLSVHNYDEFRGEECDLLLVHHSMGHELEDWILDQRCPKAMVYHNITPAEYFADGSAERYFARVGRQQLSRWAFGEFECALAVSGFNASELDALGYANVAVIPLVAGYNRLDEIRAVPPAIATSLSPCSFVVTVGRIAENKCQHVLLESLWHLNQLRLPSLPVALVIAGGTTSPSYERLLRARIDELGLSNNVYIVGKCTNEELRWYYENASALWHASTHEGFCVPLLEACAFDTPVIALGASAVPDTLGPAGLILEQAKPEEFAAATLTILESPAILKVLVDGGRNNLQRFNRETLRKDLGDWVGQILQTEQPDPETTA
jgi:glycosyltransferase involved in cell wall biosynthesis